MISNEPQAIAKEIFGESQGALMVHTIRGIISHFYHHGVILEVQIIIDSHGPVFRRTPNKASVLVTKYTAPKDDPYARVRATIFIRKDAKHHLRRLCIAHELFHAILAFNDYIKSGGKTWDGQCKKAHEPLCNEFAQELCRLHNEFNKSDKDRNSRVLFPEEIFAKGFVLDLTDVTKLPACLK
jgi:hypothetical protein